MLELFVTMGLLFAQPDSETWFANLQHATSLDRTGNYRQALCEFEALLSVPEVRANVRTHAFVLSQMADAKLELGARIEARNLAEEALEILRAAHQSESSTFAIAEGVLAQALRAEGNYRDAKDVAEHAVSLGLQTLGPLSQTFGILVTTLGQIDQDLGNFRRAHELFLQVVDISTRAGKLERGTAYQNLAAFYAMWGKPRKALAAIELALSSWNEVLEPNHPFLAFALNTKFVAYTRLVEYRQAEEIIPELLRLFEAHPQRVIVLSNVASIYIAQKKYDRAEFILQEAVAVCRRQLPAGHPIFRTIRLQYSSVLEKLNRKQDAARERAEADVILAFPERVAIKTEQVRH